MLYINIDKKFYIILVKYILLSIIIHKSIIITAIICYTVLTITLCSFLVLKLQKKDFTGKYCVNIKTILKKCMIFSIFAFYNTILLYFFILFNSHNTPYTVYSFHILSHSVINYDKVVVITVTSSLTIRRIQTPNFLSCCI